MLPHIKIPAIGITKRSDHLFLREGRPAHGFSADQMDVQVLYGLSAVFSCVNNQTESVLFNAKLFRYLRNLAQHISNQRRFCCHHVVRMGFGN